MDLNSLMSAQLGQLQQTISIGMLKTAQATQAAQATVMLEDFQRAQQITPAPHPTLGRQLDIQV